jgi:DNA-binding transcriptional ArsR family regulator
MNTRVKIGWDCGTAYDFFFSQYVLHHPDSFGLRGAWAAGVRSRLSGQDRKTLEEAQDALFFPLLFINHLPQPRDAQTVLEAIRSIPAANRLSEITFPYLRNEKVRQVLAEISARGSWTEQDRKALKEENKLWYRQGHNIEPMLTWWSQAEESGERYLQALEAYYQVFFAEEERRILPFLKEALAQGQARAVDISWQELIEELSQGVRMESLEDLSELILVPSYWSTPLIVYERLPEPGSYLFLFGARPAEMSLVPGEVVPDALLRSLKALADPTRLRILRHLTEASLTPTQLSRLLRLRAPTVTHHLSALRLAGLVRLTLEKEGERRYEVRRELARSAFAALEKFLEDKE